MSNNYNTVYQFDIGTRFDFSISVDIDKVDLAKLYVLKPDNTKIEVECELDTENGLIYYVTQENDLNLAGTYQLQLYCELDDGSWKGRGQIIKLPVNKII